MPNMSIPHLILASSSIYRQALLKRLGLPFEVIPANVDETPLPNESPADTALRLAVAKAQKIAHDNPDALVIGSDQVLLLNGKALGKPGDYDHAVAQLQQMSGQTLYFYTALATIQGDKVLSRNVLTTCQMRELSLKEIDHYLTYDRPFDTAGSAKAESLGITLMDSIQSDDPTALIGLPLIALSAMLRQFGVNPTLLASPL